MTVLLDSSVMIALLTVDHEQYESARSWLAALEDTYATCPITQGAVVRNTIRLGWSASSAVSALESVLSSKRHEFWGDDIDYTQVRFDGVVGHRQVTDAYLAQLARRHGGRLATLDHGMVSLHSDVAELVPTS